MIAASLMMGGGVAAPVMAQGLGLPESAILVIDPNRLFQNSAFGKRVIASIEAEGEALAEENRRIEGELAKEEKALTDARPGMAPDAFRQKADAFDAKVRQVRNEQEAKAVALAQSRDTAERRFLSVARPVLEELMVEAQASVLLDTRAVLLSTGVVDVTEEAARRIDVAIGDGRALDQTAPEPAPTDPAPTQVAPTQVAPVAPTPAPQE
ncbi:OmpH family outer membrane protein [Rhodobacteraceae bacterium D3-12]|nr:OmpH family outer membrane protein [Rhodobacteraceae bacterium D3-12]